MSSKWNTSLRNGRRGPQIVWEYHTSSVYLGRGERHSRQQIKWRPHYWTPQ